MLFLFLLSYLSDVRFPMCVLCSFCCCPFVSVVLVVSPASVCVLHCSPSCQCLCIALLSFLSVSVYCTALLPVSVCVLHCSPSCQCLCIALHCSPSSVCVLHCSPSCQCLCIALLSFLSVSVYCTALLLVSVYCTALLPSSVCVLHCSPSCQCLCTALLSF